MDGAVFQLRRAEVSHLHWRDRHQIAVDHTGIQLYRMAKILSISWFPVGLVVGGTDHVYDIYNYKDVGDYGFP